MDVVFGIMLCIVSAGIGAAAYARDRSRRLKLILLGHLNTLTRHSVEASQSLQHDGQDRLLNLRQAKYGRIRCLNEVLSKMGYLDSKLIEQLIDLSLRVRNNDLELDRAIEVIGEGTAKIELEGICERLDKVAKSCTQISEKLRSRRLSPWWPLGGSLSRTPSKVRRRKSKSSATTASTNGEAEPQVEGLREPGQSVAVPE